MNIETQDVWLLKKMLLSSQTVNIETVAKKRQWVFRVLFTTEAPGRKRTVHLTKATYWWVIAKEPDSFFVAHENVSCEPKAPENTGPRVIITSGADKASSAGDPGNS